MVNSRRGQAGPKAMNVRRTTKFVHAGGYVVAVEVDLIDSDTGWSPYLSPQDARKLDEAREASRRGDFRRAADLGHVFELTPIAV
jgi:hypothetical protein